MRVSLFPSVLRHAVQPRQRLFLQAADFANHLPGFHPVKRVAVVGCLLIRSAYMPATPAIARAPLSTTIGLSPYSKGHFQVGSPAGVFRPSLVTVMVGRGNLLRRHVAPGGNEGVQVVTLEPRHDLSDTMAHEPPGFKPSVYRSAAETKFVSHYSKLLASLICFRPFCNPLQRGLYQIMQILSNRQNGRKKKRQRSGFRWRFPVPISPQHTEGGTTCNYSPHPVGGLSIGNF